MTHEMTKPWNLRPGDHFVGWGPGWIVAKPSEYAGEGDIGSAAFRHREIITFVNIHTGEKRTLPATGESTIPVVQGWAGANGIDIPNT